MKSGLVWGSFLCIICLYMKLPGGPDGPDPPDGAGAAGGHLGGGASIRSSPDGQDEAIDTLIVLLRLIGGFPGGGDGSYVLLAAVGAHAGAGGLLGAGASIRSSPDGQDKAIEPPTVLLRPLVWPARTCVTSF